jgi:protein-S-isoprenylcysteine O-methyltransferase Ste14
MQSVMSMLIPALWIGWIAYWWLAGLRTHAVRRKESVSSLLSHTLPLAIGAAMLASPRWTPAWLSERAYPPTLPTYWIGVAALIAGLALSVWARRHLAGWWSSAVTLKEGHELIRSGPYRWTRHPIYTGLLLGVLGTAVALAEWRGFVAAGLIGAALFRKIAIEERFLRAAFPGDYDRYRAEVAALVPFIY